LQNWVNLPNPPKLSISPSEVIELKLCKRKGTLRQFTENEVMRISEVKERKEEANDEVPLIMLEDGLEVVDYKGKDSSEEESCDACESSCCSKSSSHSSLRSVIITRATSSTLRRYQFEYHYENNSIYEKYEEFYKNDDVYGWTELSNILYVKSKSTSDIDRAKPCSIKSGTIALSRSVEDNRDYNYNRKKRNARTRIFERSSKHSHSKIRSWFCGDNDIGNKRLKPITNNDYTDQFPGEKLGDTRRFVIGRINLLRRLGGEGGAAVVPIPSDNYYPETVEDCFFPKPSPSKIDPVEKEKVHDVKKQRKEWKKDEDGWIPHYCKKTVVCPQSNGQRGNRLRLIYSSHNQQPSNTASKLLSRLPEQEKQNHLRGINDKTPNIRSTNASKLQRSNNKQKKSSAFIDNARRAIKKDSHSTSLKKKKGVVVAKIGPAEKSQEYLNRKFRFVPKTKNPCWSDWDPKQQYKFSRWGYMASRYLPVAMLKGELLRFLDWMRSDKLL